MTSFNKNNSAFDKPSSRVIKLQVQYGSDLYELLLSSTDNQIRMKDVLDEIEQRTKVPKCHQTLMYKGQRLDLQPDAYLDDLYIFNNSKFILSGTQYRCHNKYCCDDDHSHPKITNLSTKSISSQQNNNNLKEEKSNETKDIDQRQQSFSILSKKQETSSSPIGFIPEPNKNYEYYTVPYKTDPATLLQNISSLYQSNS